ncbi:hypothetical protein [Streptacidiphilus albus]|uniref:hypothetical protein n=1 Tax=Streptacidiphilus albus TaxID=105425 RepID=UPI0012E06262|nr:hypothetical protein [Streptacidiphilus albus]
MPRIAPFITFALLSLAILVGAFATVGPGTTAHTRPAADTAPSVVASPDTFTWGP